MIGQADCPRGADINRNRTIPQYWRQVVLLSIGALLSILLLFGAIPPEGIPTIVAALIAGSIALTINESVRERRDRDARALEREREAAASRHQQEIALRIRSQREDVYAEVMAHLLASFTGGSELSEFHVRSKIVLWGTDEVIQSYKTWRDAISDLSGQGNVPIPVERKAEIQQTLAAIALAFRSELVDGPKSEITISDLTRALIDDATT